MNMGCRELRSTPTRVRIEPGQFSGAPNDVADQSRACMRAPISPPPLRSGGRDGGVLSSTLMGLATGRRSRRVASPLVLLKETEGGSHHLAGALEPAGCDPVGDEGPDLRGERHV